MRRFRPLLLGLLLAGPIVAQSIPEDFVGLVPSDLQRILTSGSMTLRQASATDTSPTASESIASVSIPAGTTGYVLGYRVGGTRTNRFDVFVSGTNARNGAYIVDNETTGWVLLPNWSLLSVAGGSGVTCSMRSMLATSGEVTATILVGTVR